ncbi:MAG: hypothetical protein IJL71_04595, partial [Oscillospiraceae bacterium]|nr:hypothetical protein [Oscillospiraceae bacterium]
FPPGGFQRGNAFGVFFPLFLPRGRNRAPNPQAKKDSDFKSTISQQKMLHNPGNNWGGTLHPLQFKYVF